MPGARRKAHHKSRLGCRNCKARKIKCDEAKPVCSNCVRRQVQCDFLLYEQGPESLQHCPAFFCSTSGLNMVDLELLHNYTTTTYLTLAEDPFVRQLYQTTVVQIGFACDYIMRALLAVSSLHIAHHRPDARDKYFAIATHHHRVATRQAMPLIAGADPQTAQTLFLFSVLTTFYGKLSDIVSICAMLTRISLSFVDKALGGPRKSDEDALLLNTQDQEHCDTGFPDWIFLLRGTKGFVDLAGVPKSGPLAPLFAHSTRRYILREGPSATTSSFHSSLTALENAILTVAGSTPSTHSPHLSNANGEDNNQRIYGMAIDELKKSFGMAESCLASQYELTDAFTWIFLVAEDFLPLLRTLAVPAVAIFAYFCVLLKKLDGQWWMQGWGKHMLTRAYDILDEQGRLWIQQAVREVGLIPTNTC